MPGLPGMALMSKGFHNRGMVLIQRPVWISQSLRVKSSEPESTVFPSGANPTLDNKNWPVPKNLKVKKSAINMNGEIAFLINGGLFGYLWLRYLAWVKPVLKLSKRLRYGFGVKQKKSSHPAPLLTANLEID